MKLRIVAWNCNMGLHDKWEHLHALAPDIAIIPECAEPDVLRRRAPEFQFSDCEWQGERNDKGLGVFAFGGVALRRHQSWDRQYHLFLPIEVRGPFKLNLLAVWAFNHRAPATVTPNPRTTRSALAHYAPFLKAAPAAVAGDFNASVFWDNQPAYERFTDVNSDLHALGLESVYHSVNGHDLGHEPDATLYWQRNLAKRYHIDYIYLPAAWRSVVQSVSVGGAAEWVSRSDHAPLVVEVDLPQTMASG